MTTFQVFLSLFSSINYFLFSFHQGHNDKYWHADSENVTADSDVPEGFYLELREPTRICIKSVHGEYLVANKNGGFRLGDGEYENATKWEY